LLRRLTAELPHDVDKLTPQGRNISLKGPSLVGSRRRRRSRGACVTEQRT